MNDLPTAHFFGLPLFKGLLLFALFYRLTRERVYQFFEIQLFGYNVILNLVFNVRLYRLFVSAYRIDIKPGAPELSIPILVF